MGLQLIFVVESNKQCKSDWIYIKETIERFYQYDKAHVKLSPVYMDGRGKYRLKEKEIKSLISQFRLTSQNNETKVIYCFDCDDFDSKPADMQFLKDAQNYCDEKGYEFAWFCKDIERVYLDKKVDHNQKGKVSEDFKRKKMITKVDKNKLLALEYRQNASNIMIVLDKFLHQEGRTKDELEEVIYYAYFRTRL